VLDLPVNMHLCRNQVPGAYPRSGPVQEAKENDTHAAEAAATGHVQDNCFRASLAHVCIACALIVLLQKHKEQASCRSKSQYPESSTGFTQIGELYQVAHTLLSWAQQQQGQQQQEPAFRALAAAGLRESQEAVLHTCCLHCSSSSQALVQHGGQ
jgi:hypothetical protein